MNKEFKNKLDVKEVIELIDNEKVSILGDEVVFYVKHVEEVDEKPDQLIGIESEDDYVEELNRFYVPVVAVGDEVLNIKPGDFIYLTRRVITSVEEFVVNTIKLQSVSERHIKVVKRK